MQRDGTRGVAALPGVCRRLAFAVAVLTPSLCVAQAPLPDYQVKAAYLYHFTQFIEWPLPNDNSPFLMCVAHEGPISIALEQLTSGKTLGLHPLKVWSMDAPTSEARSCRVLFVPAMGRIQVQQYLQTVADSNVLTVGDQLEFREFGGMIELFLEDQHIAFRLNLQAMQRAHLNASSRLLRLARQGETRMHAEGYH